MLRYFQSAYLSRYIVVLIMALVFWLPGILLAPTQDQVTNALIILPEINGIPHYILTGTAFVIFLFTGLITNHIAGDTGFTGRVSTLGLFVFVLFSSSLVSFTNISVFIVINLLFVLLIRLLYMVPETDLPVFLSFNAALLIGVAAMFFLPLIFLIVLLWAALTVHQSAYWRNYLSSAIGLASPVFFTYVWYYWFDRQSDFIHAFKNLLSVDPAILLTFTVFTYIIATIIIVLTLISVLKATAGLAEKNINMRRNMMITLYFLLFITVITLVFGNGETALMMLSIPSAVLVAQRLQHSSVLKYYNAAFIVLTMIILINHYLNLLI